MKTIKKILILTTLIIAPAFVQAQVFDGYHDFKTHLGASYQKENAIGTTLMLENGITDYLSLGLAINYVVTPISPIYEKNLYTNQIEQINLDTLEKFSEKIDTRVRINTHLSPLTESDILDIYLGPNIGLRNIGSQIGANVLVTPSFGFFTEITIPIYKFKSSVSQNYLNYYNQAVINLGIVFSN